VIDVCWSWSASAVRSVEQRAAVVSLRLNETRWRWKGESGRSRYLGREGPGFGSVDGGGCVVVMVVGK
jgi:hypothetical protein